MQNLGDICLPYGKFSETGRVAYNTRDEAIFASLDTIKVLIKAGYSVLTYDECLDDNDTGCIVIKFNDQVDVFDINDEDEVIFESITIKEREEILRKRYGVNEFFDKIKQEKKEPKVEQVKEEDC